MEKLPQRCADIEKVEVAGPGFCNVTFSQHFWRKTVCEVEAAGAAYGQSSVGQGRKTLVEYVSANPTGPLHVGHGRGAAVGDSLARLLRKAGFDVETEYYINDAGRQMRILGLSVWLRVKELAGRPVKWPEDYYRGSYIIDIAREMLAEDPSLPDMEDQAGQDRCYERAMNEILDGIKADLARLPRGAPALVLGKDPGGERRRQGRLRRPDRSRAHLRQGRRLLGSPPRPWATTRTACCASPTAA